MSRPSRHNVVWVRPDRTTTNRATPRRADTEPLSILLENFKVAEPTHFDLLSLKRAVDEQGLPSFPDLTAEAELRELLLGAAEIEHGLMAEYLYAANACTNTTLAEVVRQIAVEEMGHLITVQNLLLAAGGTPFLGRYDRSPNDFDPFPFRLEPFTFEVVAKYAACEAPDKDKVDPEGLETLKDILRDATASAGNMEPHRIGLLYMKIYWLLRETDTPLPNPAEEPWEGYPVEAIAGMFPGRHVATFPIAETLSVQGKEADWQSNTESVIVSTVERRGDALRAVARISAQGEGFAGEADAHFDRFVNVYLASKDAGPLARHFATNPWYVGSGSTPGQPEAEITLPLTIAFAKLGDRLYEILLVAITLALHPVSGFDEQKRSTIARFCIAVMREAMKPFARALPRLKISDSAESPQLSLCLTLPDYPTDPAAMYAQLAERYHEAISLARELEALPEVHILLRSATKTVRELLETRRGDLNIA